MKQKFKLYVDNPSIPATPWDMVKFMTKPYKWRLVLFFVLSFLGVLAWTATPAVVAKIVDELQATRAISDLVWWLVVLFVVLRILDEVMWRLAELTMRSMKPQMEEAVRANLFGAVLKRQYTFFVNSSSGRIGHWINRAADITNEFIDNIAWTIWGRIAAMSVSAVFLFIAHWSLGVLFVVWLAVLFTFTIKRGRKFGQLIEVQSDETSKASGQIVDAIGNHLSVRVFNATEREKATLGRQQQIIIRAHRKAWLQNLQTNIAKGQSAAIISGAALVLVLYLYSQSIVGLGEIIIFFAYFTDASSSLWQLAWALDALYRQFGKIRNSINGLAGEDERVELVEHGELPKTASLGLHDLSFAYPDQQQQAVINKLNISIAAGEKVGLVGHSGAGKSTLVGLLLGFYEPTSGEILINDKPLHHNDPSFIRAITSYVPQDTNLFNRTVAENVRYAKPEATDAEVTKALKQAQAYDFVKGLPQGVDTIIGERGVKLSGGQRQRLAIARALIQDAPLLLLDEATSALDSVSEQAIQKALHTLMKDRTAIVVAHRLSTLRHLDKILVVEAGKIIEQGSHDELLKRKGVYADLWTRQKDGFIAE